MYRIKQNVAVACATIILLAAAGCGEPQAPPSVAAPESPPLQALDEAKQAPTAKLVEDEDGSTRVVEDEATD